MFIDAASLQAPSNLLTLFLGAEIDIDAFACWKRILSGAILRNNKYGVVYVERDYFSG
jgi:hypothetical protein